MKEAILLSKGWKIKHVAPASRVESDGIGEDKWIEAASFPAQVHDILYAHKLIPEEYRVGWCAGVNWTDDLDWIYRCSFQGRPRRPCPPGLQGARTIADIYLNGELVATHDDFFVSEVVDVSHKLNVRKRTDAPLPQCQRLARLDEAAPGLGRTDAEMQADPQACA